MRRIMLVAALLASLTSIASAEPGPIGQWLMNEPLTLWDIGMMKAEEAAKDAGRVADDLGTGLIWAQYNWDNNEININLHVINALIPITHERCNQTRRSFIADIVGSVPFYLETEENLVRKILHDLIDSWFSHHGFRAGDRDEKLVEKLARIIFVEVSLSKADAGRQYSVHHLQGTHHDVRCAVNAFFLKRTF